MAHSGKPAAGNVYIKTFGCQMNEYDSEKMFSLLSSDYQPVQSADQADVIIVNTCSVRDKAVHKLFSVLGSYAPLKEKRPELIIGVGGCVAQQEGDAIMKRSPLVDFVVGTHNLSLVPSLVANAKNGSRGQAAIDYREDWESLPEEFDAFSPRVADGDMHKAAFGVFYSPVRAMVAISRGCDKHCSFCVVPTTRGPEVSRAADEIEREVRKKVRLGAREVMLLGQTVNSYGKDLKPRYRFEKLVERLAAIEGLDRIRFTSPHPAEVRKEFIELYGSIPELCPHIHLPLQSGNDRILRAMNRNYKRARYHEIVDSIRQRCPEIAITTDIIVGFPTETESDFEQTLEVMREVRYSSVFSFMYSVRPNTTAKDCYTSEDEVPHEVQSERLQRLQALGREISADINREMLGQVLEVLVDAPGKTISSMKGRIPQNTPIEIVGGSDLALGDLVEVKVIHAGPFGLRGEIVPQRGTQPTDGQSLNETTTTV